MDQAKHDYKDGSHTERISQVAIENIPISKKHRGGNKTKVRHNKVENIDDNGNTQLPKIGKGAKNCNSGYEEETGSTEAILTMPQEIRCHEESNISINIEQSQQINKRSRHKREDFNAPNQERTKGKEENEMNETGSCTKTLLSVQQTLRNCEETIAVMQETVEGRIQALASKHMDGLKLIHDEENDPFKSANKVREIQLKMFNEIHEEREKLKRERDERIRKKKDTQQARMQDCDKKHKRQEWFLQVANDTITRVEKGDKITQGLLAVHMETMREASVKRKNAARQARLEARKEKKGLQKVEAERFKKGHGPQLVHKTQKLTSGDETVQLPLTRHEEEIKDGNQLRRQKDAKRERLAFLREMREELQAREQTEADHRSLAANPNQQTTTEEKEEAEVSHKIVKEAWDDSSDEDEDDEDLAPNMCSEAGTSSQVTTSGNKRIVRTQTSNFIDYCNRASRRSPIKCDACGYENHDFVGCKFKGYTCTICNKIGHTAKACRFHTCKACGKERHWFSVCVHNAATCIICNKVGHIADACTFNKCLACGNEKHNSKCVHKKSKCSICNKVGHIDEACRYNMCRACGQENHYLFKCIYKTYTCRECKRLGHIAQACRSKLV
ncbi:hypothetical protein PPYR_07438 [Photinus pyralis]|uniref:CCHC-type domain-containing protein n=1 Tax=Photinus pyralis TaxID=7054 RepID=A0A1Y1JYF2_PHOPY|nr:eukaryotic translation initiation factor 5B-like [Photinus pyralis]XP_031342005.1 eukaryotic translation initiation factor 5B-like [Photinus pyralis]XP_031349138.1 eukaryotic translation initiation factor 5B-like [Photinus pyralis]XP_031349139.1 eukaryotic translation initiation factor 5B-like [Photinus pyralis]KAB0795708.1 hypothetical protein PPYR_09769 [Photinus pyralis]KAB0799558.1 hypothetical protein PPYR_07438 [Photinus pyralis]